MPPATPPLVPGPTTVPPPTSPVNPSLPGVPRHYSWIRLANLAYYGTPLDAYAKNLLTRSIDLVIPNVSYLSTVAGAAPATPKLVYSNVSNIYLDLLTDWLSYADKNRMNREAAFYHVTKATPFAGLSASAVPVDRFWGVFGTTASGAVTDLTSDAADRGGETVPTPGRGGQPRDRVP